MSSKVARYYVFKPTDYPFLVKLVLERSDDRESHLDVSFELSRVQRGDEPAHLLVRFVGVRQFELDKNWSIDGHVLLEVEPIRDRQMEALNYSVTDSEREIRFVCKDFNVSLVANR